MKAKQLIPIMISDFLFWAATAGMGPIMSRLAEAHLDAVTGNLVIARMVLMFTLGALLGRATAGAWQGPPKTCLMAASTLSGLGLLTYFSNSPFIWMAGHALQGLALGLYGVNMFKLTAMLIPPGQRMRGFAMIGLADFLGFSFGPVISGLIYGVVGFSLTFVIFLSIILGALCAGFALPNLVPDNSPGPSPKKIDFGKYLHFLPLHLCMLICLLFHIFYSRYLPITYDTGVIAVESYFFSGYMLGGLGVRLGIVQWLETLTDRRIFFIAIGFMCTTAVLVGVFPFIDSGLGVAAIFTGVFYGVGFETLYIFCLTYIAANVSERERGRILAFVFMGFDLSNLVAGSSFGPLANKLTPVGLMWVLLIFVPVLLLLPLFLKPGREFIGSSLPSASQ